MGRHNKSKKRSRNSSSDAEITPDRKRDKLTHSAEDSDDPVTMASLPEGEPGITEGLSAKLAAIVETQQQLRKDFNNNYVKQSEQIAALIDRKLATLRAEIDGKLSAVCDDLRHRHKNRAIFTSKRTESFRQGVMTCGQNRPI